MYRSLYFLFRITIPVLGFAQAARADEASDAVIYVVTYIEVRPSSQSEAMALLRQYREASRKEEGNVRFERLPRRGRSAHYSLFIAGSAHKALGAHGMAAHTIQCRVKFPPLRVGPETDHTTRDPPRALMKPLLAPGTIPATPPAIAPPPGKKNLLFQAGGWERQPARTQGTLSLRASDRTAETINEQS